MLTGEKNEARFERASRFSLCNFLWNRTETITEFTVAATLLAFLTSPAVSLYHRRIAVGGFGFVGVDFPILVRIERTVLRVEHLRRHG
jgi:hypothetical protein